MQRLKKLHTLLPDVLRKGDEIRVIAPSRSSYIISDDVIQIAQKRLESLGFKVTYGQHWSDLPDAEGLELTSAKLTDLHEAFADTNVKAIFTAIGGYNSNTLLDDIDFELIRRNPKVICGYSDITVLLNAIYKKTGMITYLGPHFSSWGMEKGFEYSETAFKSALLEHSPVIIEPSEQWSSDEWYIDQVNRKFSDGHDSNMAIAAGDAEGKLLGGNITSLLNLVGTQYMPSLANSILLLEQSEVNPKSEIFRAQLDALSMQSDFPEVNGILIGRFPASSDMNTPKLQEIILRNKRLTGIPIVANVNFGHTTPINYFPIGANCAIKSSKQVKILVYPALGE